MDKFCISELKRHARNDDQLDPVGRIEVADYLVRNSDVAVRGLANLRSSAGIRAFGSEYEPSLQRVISPAAKKRRSSSFAPLYGIPVMAKVRSKNLTYWDSEGTVHILSEAPQACWPPPRPICRKSRMRDDARP